MLTHMLLYVIQSHHSGSFYQTGVIIFSTITHLQQSYIYIHLHFMLCVWQGFRFSNRGCICVRREVFTQGAEQTTPLLS